jgi:geranylgeranyl pyrophosphate synthase
MVPRIPGEVVAMAECVMLSSLENRVPVVVAAMEAFLEREVPAPAFRALSRRLVAGAERQAWRAVDGYGWVPYIDLAFDVTEAAGGDPELAVALASASAFCFSALDVIDDVADGDTQAHWQDVPAAQQQLAGLAALVSYPQMLIAALPLATDRIAAMQALLARRLMLAGIGQHADLVLAGASEPSPDDVEASLSAKSGEQLALYCEWAALAAGNDGQAVASWGAFGRALGTAGQIRSDLSELCHDDWSRDLASGKRILPVAYHLARLGTQKAAFLALLERARTDVLAQREVRQILLDSGSVRMAALVAQVHAGRARRALACAGAREPAKGRLEAQLASHPLSNSHTDSFRRRRA